MHDAIEQAGTGVRQGSGAPPLALRLFGPFEARVEGRSLPRLRSRKGQWLLALLALRPGAEVDRSWLAGVLWPDSGEPQALAGLRNSLMDLRRALGTQGGRLRSPTLSTLTLDLESAEVDVVTFDQAISRGDRASLESAVALYRGPLLEGCPEEWVFQERETRAQAYLAALEQLAAAEAGGDLPAAERYLRRAVTADPTRETSHRALMRVLAASGNYSAAMQAYRDLRLLLHRELNSEPDPETRALYGQIRAAAREKAALGARHPTLGKDDGPASREPAEGSRAALQAPGAEGQRSEPRVVLLYERGAQPDEQVVALLEEALSRHGYPVFLDRHVTVGLEWARAIEREVHDAEAVIPLLSPAAVQSEMLAHEVRAARDAAWERGGRPLLLPVRVCYADPLPPGELAATLGPLAYASWDGPEQNGRLVEQLLAALRSQEGFRVPGAGRRGEPHAQRESGCREPGPLARASFEAVGGAVPLDSEFYVVRPTDGEFQQAIARRDSIVLVKGARQMGKTSLLGRGLEQARRAGARVVSTDFQQLSAADLASSESFCRALGSWVADQLDLEVFPDQVWDARFGPSMNFSRYMRRHVLAGNAPPLVWGLDEVDLLLGCEFGSEVFGLWRSWHNQRVTDPTGPWSHLTLAIAYATEAHLLITNIHQSPFNVGTRVTLEDFTLAEVADLNRRHSGPLATAEAVERFHRLLNGQPYLVRRGLYALSTGALDLEALEGQADRDEGIFGDHLRRILAVLAQNAELLEVVREVLRGQPCPTAESFYRLRSAGILAGETVRDARPRCPLYGAYLARYLL